MNPSCQRVFAAPFVSRMACVPTPSTLSRTLPHRPTCFCGAFRSMVIVSRRRQSMSSTMMVIPLRMPQKRMRHAAATLPIETRLSHSIHKNNIRT